MVARCYKGLINKYGAYLPIEDLVPVSLQEGNTPLLPLNNLKKILGLNLEIYAKFEGHNPTGSFKDRGMTVAVSQAVKQGAKAVICASTGNTSASAAAYAAKASLKAIVIIPEGKIAQGKLAQAIAYGAQVVQITGNFDKGLDLVRRFADNPEIVLVNSVNPYRIIGQKTIAFEVVEQLSISPEYHYLPVGNAGNITAHWLGYKEYFENGRAATLPKLIGYQAAGAAPFIEGAFIEHPETLATAIRIGKPASWEQANKAVAESKGWFGKVSDEEILAAQKLLATKEGIFCEPASAASFAGLIRDCLNDKIPEHSHVVCTLTGNGLKDPDVIMNQASECLHTVSADEIQFNRQLQNLLNS